MQVNNSINNFPVPSTGSNQTLPNRSPELRERDNQNAQQQRVNRIDVDQNAINLLEQESNSNRNNTSYDQPSQKNTTAVETYQAVGSIEQRENVQQLLGVDVFA